MEWLGGLVAAAQVGANILLPGVGGLLVQGASEVVTRIATGGAAGFGDVTSGRYIPPKEEPLTAPERLPEPKGGGDGAGLLGLALLVAIAT